MNLISSPSKVSPVNHFLFKAFDASINASSSITDNSSAPCTDFKEKEEGAEDSSKVSSVIRKESSEESFLLYLLSSSFFVS